MELTYADPDDCPGLRDSNCSADMDSGFRNCVRNGHGRAILWLRRCIFVALLLWFLIIEPVMEWTRRMF